MNEQQLASAVVVRLGIVKSQTDQQRIEQRRRVLDDWLNQTVQRWADIAAQFEALRCDFQGSYGEAIAHGFANDRRFQHNGVRQHHMVNIRSYEDNLAVGDCLAAIVAAVSTGNTPGENHDLIKELAAAMSRGWHRTDWRRFTDFPDLTFR